MKPSMTKDRRWSARQSTNNQAKFQASLDALPRDCLVTDISDGGVRLHVDGYDVPDEFLLMVAGAGGQQRACRVIWRLGCEVGAEFVESPRRPA